MGIASTAAAQDATAEQRGNLFNDPYTQVTSGMPECATPPGPMITLAEMHAEEHARAERGTRCYLDGECRLPNAYAYDKEIIPRVKLALQGDARFADTSVWAEGQRRWVTLKGCVRSKAQGEAIVRRVQRIDDVQAVINQLTVKAR